MAAAEDYKMPFGKHKGQPLKEIPIAYLDWCLGIDLLKSTRENIKAYLATQAEYDQMGETDDREDISEEEWRNY